jgi:ribosome-associated heat shock protein Hsp15
MREDRQRLDKWLWFARFAKTRTLAAKLVADGFVRVNGQRADNAAKAVAVGDVLTVALVRTTAVIRVEGLGLRRGPVPEARSLYTELVRDRGELVSDPGRG